MRRLVVVGAVLLAACSSPTEGQGQAQPSPTAATATTAAITTTEAATTTRPATTRPIKLVVGKYCAAMHAAGWSFEKARAYYEDHGQPAHMDADGDGIPCETVYGESRRARTGTGPAGGLRPRLPGRVPAVAPLPTLTAPTLATGLGLTTAKATLTAWTPMATGLGATATANTCDGTGYPDRLAGQQIPLGARIIAVCDAFTAMTFPRAYAAQLTVPQAIDELRHSAGTQFDPAVVDALANLIIGLAWPPEPASTYPANLDRVGSAAGR